jgi:hypothetical protein
MSWNLKLVKVLLQVKISYQTKKTKTTKTTNQTNSYHDNHIIIMLLNIGIV